MIVFLILYEFISCGAHETLHLGTHNICFVEKQEKHTIKSSLLSMVMFTYFEDNM